jgi:3-deoxy-manno-octulosonate cytidylyltransferase (CMP-KDO synthetase)
MMSKKIICVIPARLASTRFPRKMLASVGGKPLLEWVWQAATRVKRFDSVLFAIDSPETAQLIEGFGGRYVMTSEACACGTDRLIEVMKSGVVAGDIWVNWQGDEPLIDERMIDQLLKTCENDEISDLWTLKKRIVHEKDIKSPNIAKIVCNMAGYALYFSRSPIPFYRAGYQGEEIYYKHVGIYAFTTEALRKISFLRPTPLELAEQLEQLRFLQNNMKIMVHETDKEVVGVDTPEDLEKVEEMLKK